MSDPQLQTIAIEQLQRGRYQPRQVFDQAQLQELADSIKSAGLLQPLIIRPVASGGYEIIAGERRWRAAQLAGLTEVPCLVKNYTDEQALEASIIENVSRDDLNAIEEARAYKRLMDEFSYIHEEVAAAIGKSRAAISNTLRLLNLDEQIQDYIIQGKLSEGHGKAIASLKSDQQRYFANLAVKNAWSVRQMERKVKQSLSAKADVDAKSVDVKRLEKTLSEQIGCPTTIDFSRGIGSMKIDFHDLEVLQGVLEKLGYKEGG